MPPRPVIKDRQTSRPLSAVYIGKGGSGSLGSLSGVSVSVSPSLADLSQSAAAYSSLIDGTPPTVVDSIPDLPEPPSPSSSVGSISRKSGLPSPPATNSTGSGSTSGDRDPEKTKAGVEVPPLQLRKGSERDGGRPLSLHSNGTSSTSTSGEYRGAATPMRRSSVSFSSHDDDSGPSRSSSSSRLGHSRSHSQDTGVEGDFDDDYDTENHQHKYENDGFNDDDHDDDNDSNFDGDDTARLDRRLEKERVGKKSENVLALQKVRSLAHRNQLALDKLSKLSPSPASRSSALPSSNSNSRSPAPSTTSSSRHSNSHSGRQLRPPPQDLARSGSETERESTTHHSATNSNSSTYDHSPSISSSYLSTTPPPATPSHHLHHPHTTHTHTSASSSSSSAAYRRVRQTSAPDSPSKARRMISLAGDGAASSSGNLTSSALTRSPSSGMSQRRHRASLASASVSQLQLTDFSEEEDDRDHDPPGSGQRTATNTARERDRDRTRDRTLSERDMIIQSALAAAATSRQSPLGSRRRSALPKEFRSDLVEDSPSPHPNGNGSVRRSLVGGGRRDSPDDDRREDRRERDSWRREVEPMTPLRSTATITSGSTSNSNGITRSSTLRDPRVRYSGGPGSGSGHNSTPSGRWSSEDWRSPTLRDRDRERDSANITSTTSRTYRTSLSNEDGSPNNAANLKAERRQSLRGGSAESALMWSPGGRSLLGEGLRAAGLSRRRGDEEVSPSKGGARAGANAASRSTPGGADLFRDRERERRVDWSPQDLLDDRKRRVLERNQPQMRAATSMAHYQYRDHNDRGDDADEDDNPMHERELVLHRGHRSAYSLAAPRDLLPESSRRGELVSPHDRDRAGSALSRYDTITTTSKGGEMPSPALRASHLLERSGTSSPFGSTRRYTQPPTSSNLNASTSSAVSNTTAGAGPEHTRLMMESLAMFENQVNKLPRVAPLSGSGGIGAATGIGTGTTQAELTRNAQNVVFAAERLLLMLKHGSARAMEASVEAEVDLASSTSSRDGTSAKAKASPAHPAGSTANTDAGEIWTKVAAEYRESARTADELVRGVTALLLGFGRVVKEFGVHVGGSEFGSPSVHGRTLSMDDEGDGREVQVIGERKEAGGVRELREGGGGHGEGSGGVSSGRHSVASSSRRSWDPAPREREREPRDREREFRGEKERDRDRDREDALRRLIGGAGAGARSESVLARASPATFQRLRDRGREGLRERDMSPLPPAVLEASRRLFTPREQQREQQPQARPGSGGGGTERRGTPKMSTLDSKETIHPPRSNSTAEGSGHGTRAQRYSESNAISREYYYEPSPTPASRTITSTTITPSTRRTPPPADREKIKTLTPLTIPRPLPVLPSETTRRPGTAHAALGSATTPSTSSSALPSNERSDSSSGLGNSTSLTRSGTTRDRDRAAAREERERRRATVTSRAVFPSSLTTPKTATTTASRSTQAQVTFSRPSASAMVSVSATLSEMQEKEKERARTTSTASASHVNGIVQSPLEGADRLSRSNSESKEGVRERRKTLGRVSLDTARDAEQQELERRSGTTLARNSVVHAADRSAATTILQQPAGGGGGGGGRRERRRTVTDIWPAS